MTPNPKPLSTTAANPSHGYQLLSTIAIVAWCLFIGSMLIAHEVALRATWDFDHIAAKKDISWWFSSMLSLSRTVFAQGHGPITAMHLARLAVGSLDAPWASPTTWLHVFWLANRRWSGLQGVLTMFTSAFQLPKPRIIASFSMLTVIALLTPGCLSLAYTTTEGYIERQITVSGVSMVDLAVLVQRSNKFLQNEAGEHIWSRGVAPAVQFPDNIYAGHYMSASSTGGSRFITGSANKTGMNLVGIRVAGGCEYLQDSDRTFQDRCTDAFSNATSIFVNVMASWSYNATTCSNIPLNAEFGRDRLSNATALFHFVKNTFSGTDTDFTQRTTFRCDVSAGAGTATVDGRSMTFNNFTYIAPSEYATVGSQFLHLDPLSAVIQTGLDAYETAWDYKVSRAKMNIGMTGNDAKWEAELMWNGIVSMSTAVWLLAATPTDLPGIQTFTATGILRRDIGLVFLVLYLGIWFFGMVTLSARLLRPTWASSLDTYAVARLLQHQPVLSSTREAWFTELEENPEVRQNFEMHHWRSARW